MASDDDRSDCEILRRIMSAKTVSIMSADLENFLRAEV